MNGPKLRGYQNECKDSFRVGYRSGQRNLGASLPTGTGKTVIFSSMAADAHALGNQVDVVVHRDTLVQQAVDKLSKVIPAERIGIVKAERNDVDAPVRVISVQTLCSDNRLHQLTRPKLSIIDEAHVSVSDRYMRYFRHIGAVPSEANFDGQTFLAGFSATWMRNDNRGLGDIWQDVCFKRSIKWAVRNGFLVEPRAIQLGGDLDLSNVRTVSNPDSENFGDYNIRDLDNVVMVEDLLNTVVDGYVKFAAGRPAVLFAPTTASARYFLDGLRAAGVPVAEIFAGTSAAQRRWSFAEFDQGRTHVLGTCTALAEGWDCPKCSVALMVRPTKSLLMFIQQVGRILRPWVGKDHGLILDFVGITDDKDMRSIVDLRETPEAREVENPCPNCGKERCFDCGNCKNWECHLPSCMCDIEDDFERTPIQHTAKKISGIISVDLFAGTNARWLRTYAGIPFVQTKTHTYWVSMKDGAWAVGRCGAKSRNGGVWLAEGLDSGEALDMGSEYALAEDPTIADKRSAWRNGGGRASDQQIATARRYRITGAEEMSKSDLSDAISVAVASNLLAGLGAK
jgi:superfamily II DNA or RNA helicase